MGFEFLVLRDETFVDVTDEQIIYTPGTIRHGSPQLRNSTAQQGYDMVRQQFSWEEKLKGYEQLN